jgi:hypothetical protein
MLASSADVDQDILREQLAALAHEQRCGWMAYLFKQGTTHNDGSFTIRPWAVERRLRQMGMPYADLPEEEKASDRAEVDRMLAVLRGGT